MTPSLVERAAFSPPPSSYPASAGLIGIVIVYLFAQQKNGVPSSAGADQANATVVPEAIAVQCLQVAPQYLLGGTLKYFFSKMEDTNSQN